MVVSLLEHERVKTTSPKAKELRSWADKVITLGKKGTLHARRQVFALLRNEDIVKKLFDEIAPRMKDRQGGYTRIYKVGWRTGDAAPLSLVELVGIAAPEEKKKSTMKKAREALKRVTSGRKGKKQKEEKKEKTEKTGEEKEKTE
jgi:large subunit ribosomal protein L17